MSNETLDWVNKVEDRRMYVMTAVAAEEERLGRDLTGTERRAVAFKYPPIPQPKGVAVG